MQLWIDAAVVLLVLTNLKLLGSSRLSASIRTVAAQGVLLGLIALLANAAVLQSAPELHIRLLAQVFASTFLKAVIFPWLLMRTIRDSRVVRETRPLVGYTTSILSGIAILGVAVWISWRLPLPGQAASTLLVPAALFTMMVGLFIIISRKLAIMQVLGYLAMENGIYAFGMSLAEEQPLLVEMGILLDVFMAVFVMGITIYHINREFDHIDTDQLASLKD